MKVISYICIVKQNFTLMKQKFIDLVEQCCDDIRRYPEDMETYLNLIVDICKLNKID